MHVTPSGDRGATTRMFSASKTAPCWQVSGARQAAEPSCLGQDFQIRQEFPTCLKLREKHGDDYDLHL